MNSPHQDDVTAMALHLRGARSRLAADYANVEDELRRADHRATIMTGRVPTPLVQAAPATLAEAAQRQAPVVVGAPAPPAATRSTLLPPSYQGIAATPRDVTSGFEVDADAATLVILNAVLEADPLQSWTFPATAGVWSALLPQERKKSRHQRHASRGRGDDPQALVPWVLVNASHVRRNVVVHAESLRRAMLESPHAHHCVIEGATVHGSQDFWPRWMPRPANTAAARAAAGTGAAPELRLGGASDARFPGEVVPPLRGLVAPDDAMLRRQAALEIL